MKKPILLLPLFLLALTLQAQITPRNLLAKAYPLDAVTQMLVAKDQWKPYPATPDAWKQAVPDTTLSRVVKDAEKLIDFKFEPIPASVSLDFVRSGDRLRHSGISFGKRNVLMKLILAESIEGKDRFTETILNGVWSICEESFWGVPAHINDTGLPDPDNPVVDLFAAETGALLGLADYFIGQKFDKINPQIRKRIYFETNRRFFVPMLTKGDTYKYMSKTSQVNNWNPWIMSNWIAATLLLEPDEKRRSEMLRGSMLGLDRYINSLGADGGCDEGPSYWFAAGASVYDCLELLAGATNSKIDIYQEDIIKKMASYVYKTHIDGHYFVNFADADPKLRPDGLLLYRLGKAVKDEKLVEMGKWAFQNFTAVSTSPEGFHRPRRIENLLTINQIDGGKISLTPVQEAWIGDIQVLTARAGDGLFLATHGGHNAESHNHNDVGDFIIYVKGQPMIVDAGRGNYTARTFSNKRYELWFTQSEYHNLPIVNGIGQKAGRKFEATAVKSNVNGKEASLQMDIAAAYPPEAGITSWKRLVALNRTKNQVEITEDYVLKSEPKSIQEIFMTVCDVDSSEPGKVKLKGAGNTSLTLSYDPKMWSVSTEKPSTDGMEYESFKTKWDNRPVTRIVLDSKQLKQNGKHRLVFDTKE
ncbi:heparinase II/III domain-containing protein [Dyadobacter aurulentus]|uniref:heparinase II/III domain-containing protein n=1 Tax=Dyadobacter sp. UC 10 TaxID=2605428 RepID=UPI0011F2C88D|nr:heparinase II/III family protein [Dyadobacter sp. UC 10]KAA0989117.1 hypothetical protein FXO21_02520 [Dyadobacter sp. UC 10]